MGLDGITMNRLAQELDRELRDSTIDKIQQPGRFDLLLTFHGKGGPRLLISANPNYPVALLGPGRYENPAQAPMFCMLLRKHLVGAKLLSVDAPDYERLLRFRFTTRNEIGDSQERILIAELQNRHSNIILLDEHQVILDSLVHVGQATSRYREVLPARIYVLPPKQNKPLPQDRLRQLETLNPEDFATLLPDKRLDKALLELCLGFSPQLVTELLYQADVEGNVQPAALAKDASIRLYHAAVALLRKITTPNEEAWVYPEALKGRGDYHCLPLDSLGERRQTPGISAAIREIYLRDQAADRVSQKRKHLLDRVQKELTRKLNLLSAYASDLEKSQDYEQKRKAGELILSQLNDLPEQIPESGEISLVDYYDPEGKEFKVTLDRRWSVRTNANRLFRQYTKDKETAAYATEKIKSTQEEIAYLQSLESLLENASDLADLEEVKHEIDQALTVKTKTSQPTPGKTGAKAKGKTGGKTVGKIGGKAKGKKGSPNAKKKGSSQKVHNEAPLPPRRYFTSDGLELLAGRNNWQNDQLTMHRARPDDLWFHAKNRPGTHVILRTEGRGGVGDKDGAAGKGGTEGNGVPDRSILQAAETAAWFSRSAGEVASSLAAPMDIDYCPVSHVKKPKGAKPGHVIYENYHTVTVRAVNPDLNLASEPEINPADEQELDQE